MKKHKFPFIDSDRAQEMISVVDSIVILLNSIARLGWMLYIGMTKSGWRFKWDHYSLVRVFS